MLAFMPNTRTQTSEALYHLLCRDDTLCYHVMTLPTLTNSERKTDQRTDMFRRLDVLTMVAR